MARMTPDARNRVDAYVRQVRSSLVGAQGVDADEVIEGIREHLEHALAGHAEPVTVDALEPVLEDLGRPLEWTDLGHTTWRTVLSRLHRGPEDWRLAYLTLASFVLGLAFADLLWFLIPTSFFLGRAGVAAVLATGADLDGRRWLLYPPLVLGYAVVVPAAVIWPVIAIHAGVSPGGFLVEILGVRSWNAGLLMPEAWPTVGPWAGLALGAWWSLAGLTVRARPHWLSAFVRPFAEGARGEHGRLLYLPGLLVGMISGLLLAF